MKGKKDLKIKRARATKGRKGGKHKAEKMQKSYLPISASYPDTKIRVFKRPGGGGGTTPPPPPKKVKLNVRNQKSLNRKESVGTKGNIAKKEVLCEV